MNKIVIHHSRNIFYRIEGEGLPVMLIHGFAEDGSLWDKQVLALKDKFRIIVPDLPGSGHSSQLPGETSLEELADCLKAILQAEDIGQCILIGHSMGGYITLAFAEKYPDNLRSFGLFHSTAYADSEEKKAHRRKSIEFIRKHGSPAFIRQSIPNLFAEHFRKEHPEIVAGLTERYSDFRPDSLVFYYRAMIERPDRTRVLKEFSGPVLFIIGDQDPAVPLSDSLAQAHLPRLCHIHILENCGHLGMLEKSRESCRILEEFLLSFSGSKVNP